jgi:hypothetical protein
MGMAFQENRFCSSCAVHEISSSVVDFSAVSLSALFTMHRTHSNRKMARQHSRNSMSFSDNDVVFLDQ